MMEEFNYDDLRDDLINYFGTAVYYNPMAQADLVYVNTCSDSELISVAINNNFDLSRYERGDKNAKIR